MNQQTSIPQMMFAQTEADLERVYNEQLGAGAWQSLAPADRAKVKRQIWKSGAETMQETFRNVVENVISGP